jgi:hypothetical protein
MRTDAANMARKGLDVTSGHNRTGSHTRAQVPLSPPVARAIDRARDALLGAMRSSDRGHELETHCDLLAATSQRSPARASTCMGRTAEMAEASRDNRSTKRRVVCSRAAPRCNLKLLAATVNLLRSSCETLTPSRSGTWRKLSAGGSVKGKGVHDDLRQLVALVRKPPPARGRDRHRKRPQRPCFASGQRRWHLRKF